MARPTQKTPCEAVNINQAAHVTNDNPRAGFDPITGQANCLAHSLALRASISTSEPVASRSPFNAQHTTRQHAYPFVEDSEAVSRPFPPPSIYDHNRRNDFDIAGFFCPSQIARRSQPTPPNFRSYNPECTTKY